MNNWSRRLLPWITAAGILATPLQWIGMLPSERPSRPTFQQAVDHATRALMARYDAAQTDSSNERYWALSDGLSADAANSPGVRRTLRNRSRYEYSNNGWYCGITRTLVDLLLGSGPRLQVSTDDEALGSQVEDAWARWSEAAGLFEALRTMVSTRIRDGECFALLTTNEQLESPEKLALTLLEGEQVTTPTLSGTRRYEIDGIEFDERWNVRNYKVLRDHPGGAVFFGNSLQTYDVAPSSMLHYFEPERPGQHRGVPDMLAGLPLFAHLRRFTVATLHAAEAAALFATFLETSSPSVAPAEGDLAPFEAVSIVRSAINILPEGYRINSTKPEHPATTYSQFVAMMLEEIARSVCLPANLARGNSSDYNFSSAQLDHLFFGTRTVNQRRLFIERILNRIYRAWRAEAILTGSIPAEAAGLKHSWHLDPVKPENPESQANADETNLRSGVKDLALIHGEHGRDSRESLVRAARTLGVTVPEYQELLRQSLFAAGIKAAQAGAVGGTPSERPATPDNRPTRATAAQTGERLSDEDRRLIDRTLSGAASQTLAASLKGGVT
jgi:lambda family phage portal protein